MTIALHSRLMIGGGEWSQGLHQEKASTETLCPEGVPVAGPTHGLRSSQPGPVFWVTPSCAILYRVQIREGRKGFSGREEERV